MSDSQRPRPLLIATNNPGKMREFATLLAGLPLTFLSLKQAGISFDVDENGQTLAENALIKARAYGAASRLPTLADDSGLEVDALDGAPGICSARYAGPGATDQDRYRKLLAVLGDLSPEHRSARFRCVIALSLPDGSECTVDGACEGLIGAAPRGEHGFGYDPIFYLPALGCTMAELSSELKDRISHRARAVMRIRPALRRLAER